MEKIAKELSMGDTILVNFGKGRVPRIVDGINHNAEQKTVIITLYTESGKRPKIKVEENFKVTLK